LQEKGIIVNIKIQPAVLGSKRAGKVVVVDGNDVAIVNEKDSLTSLGRDELQDDRISKMAVLSRWGVFMIGFCIFLHGRTCNRMPVDEGLFPEELKIPIAIAENLLNPSAVKSLVADADDTKVPEERSTVVSEKSEEVPSSKVRIGDYVSWWRLWHGEWTGPTRYTGRFWWNASNVK
jgi:hypothetical protein